MGLFSLSSLADYVSNHPGEVDIFSLVLALTSILISVLLYLKTKQQKVPVYCHRRTNVNNESINTESLNVSYSNKTLKALSIVKLAFWNTGRDTISSSDVSTKDQLRIEFGEECEILSCDIIKQTKLANNFKATINEDKKTIILGFDFLDYKEGVVLVIKIAGKTYPHCILKGSIKGVRTIKKKSFVYDVFNHRQTSDSRASFSFREVLSVMSAVIVLVSAFSLLFKIYAQNNQHIPFDTPILLIYLLVGCIFHYIAYIFRRDSVPNDLLPSYINDDL